MHYINCNIEDHIATVQLNNPPVNYLSVQLINELDNILDLLLEKDKIRVIIITGKGKFFSAGVNIEEIAEINSFSDSKEFRLRGRKLLRKMLNSETPLVAAINNVCLGGGLELAMACHIRIATVNARLGLPEINFGILPGFGGLKLLPELTGSGKAIEMILTGEKFLVKDIQETGLVNKVVSGDNLISEAKKIAFKIREKEPLSTSSALKIIRQERLKYFDQESETETRLFDNIYETGDWREKVSAFLGKKNT